VDDKYKPLIGIVIKNVTIHSNPFADMED